MQTLAGGKTLVATMTKQYGSYEAWQNRMRELGAKGGRASGTGGFFADRELARRAGALGGRKSTRQGVGNGQHRAQRTTKTSVANQIPVDYKASLTFPRVVIMRLSLWRRILKGVMYGK